MSGKLDQSLDEILSTRRTSARRGRGRRAPTNTGKSNGTTASAPVGGIKKTTKITRMSAKSSVPTGPAAGNGESKIIVSNLPPDVNETQIKEYFVKSVGPTKRVTLTYGPNGQSRGIATIVFSKPGSANQAATELNGLLVDKRPMRIEVVIDASRAPPPVPVKALSERIAQPKAQPKPATATKATAHSTSTRGGRGRGRAGRRGRNPGRPKAKTAEELDAEMVDYWDGNAANGAASGAEAGAVTNGADQPAAANAGEDLGMDEIS
ncbi:hypothetical protein MMC16_005380, partial [Acarospora aff. strigata]|nr:hypothetical protein [Acarospora aff. strigata]